MVEGSPSWSAKALSRHFSAAALILARLFGEIARNSVANSYKDSFAEQLPLAVPFDGLISP
jgi:hypothetical protein